MCENESQIRGFLKLFLNLRMLLVPSQGWGPGLGILEAPYWPNLEQLDTRGMWTSESEFICILEKYSKSLVWFGLHSLP